jgi:hypothetical protein
VTISTSDILLDRLRVRADARPINITNVWVIRESMRQNGGEIKQPILCRPLADEPGYYEIIFGRHRYEASLAEELTTIPAIVEDLDDLHAELMMIDENLCRAELSPAARALAISRRKAIYEALHPETQHGTPGVSRQVGDTRERSDAERFTKATSDATGKSERTIQREAERGDKIGSDNLVKIEGTSLDSGAELDALAKLPEDHRTRLIERAAAGEDVSAKAGDLALPFGSRSIMGSRQEPDDSLDYFPTPPWATRALIEIAFRHLGIENIDSADDPACGEGHIAEVLREYVDPKYVFASDIFDYGYSERFGPQFDYLNPLNIMAGPDWVITNPPFGDKTEPFVLRAIREACVGVAMFVRLQWLESGGRYENIFRDHPPTLIAFFAERVNLCKGRWDPEGTTATAYIWLIWIKGKEPRAPFWIPPGQRNTLTRPDDAERFTAHPVIKSNPLPPRDPETGEIREAAE